MSSTFFNYSFCFYRRIKLIILFTLLLPIAMNAQKEIFIVGYHGTIIKSSDNGGSWEKLKNGHSPLADDASDLGRSGRS